MKRNIFETIRIFGAPLCSLRFADGGGSADNSNGNEDKNDDKDEADDKGDGKQKQEEEKKFTQSDIDDAVEKRLARERHKWEREHPEAKKDDDKKQEKDGKTDPSDTDAVKQQAENRVTAANQRLVQAEAKAVALSLGVKPERVGYAVRMADLSKVDVDDELGADTDAIKKAMTQVLTDIPELKSTKADDKNKPGFKVGGDGDSSGNGDKNTKMSYRDAVAAHYKK